MKQSGEWGLSSGTLKIIALVTMIMDHATAIFVNRALNPDYYMLGRCIGRLAFPIYCFLIVEGFYHTHNVKKYGIRLFLFALISEVPFDLAFYGTVFYVGHQNVFFTLLLGLLLIWLTQWALSLPNNMMGRGLVLIGLIAVYFISQFFQADYGFLGVVLIFFFYMNHESKAGTFLSNGIMNILLGIGGKIQYYGILASIPILLYNGKKGVSLKYFFYVIYPLHLLLFFWIENCYFC